MLAPDFIVADDFTGANAVAALLVRRGYRVVACDWRRICELDVAALEVDLVVVSGEFRSGSDALVQERITDIMSFESLGDLLSLRIDSTLRGNFPEAISSALETLRKRTSARVVFACLPAFPAAGRITVDGVQHVGGVPLEATELSNDPLNPLRSSNLQEIISAKGLKVSSLTLKEVRGSTDVLNSRVVELTTTNDVLVFDACTDDDISRVAEVICLLDREMIDVRAVDSGPLTVALCEARSQTTAREKVISRGPLVAVVGSSSELSRDQVSEALRSPDTAEVLARFIGSGLKLDVEALDKDLSDLMDSDSCPERLVVRIEPSTQLLVGVNPEEIIQLSRDFAETVASVLLRRSIAGLFCTGGDLASNLLFAIGAGGVRVRGEVFPLAVSGSVIGGKFDGLPIVTKGGFTGDLQGISVCLDYLNGLSKESKLGNYVLSNFREETND